MTRRVVAALARIERVWRELSHDWQAVTLGALVVLTVLLGVSIPW